jgi:rod shape-determining protein MreC
MTVLNGSGLVGKVTTVGQDTATVLLANDPEFTVGTRLEKTDELGFATGQGDRPMRVQMLNGKAKVKKGDRLVSFGSTGNRPFVPGVPIGEVVRVEPVAGDLTRTVHVRPFASFTRLDVVGIVVEPPRKNPRDTVLPPKPKATPTPTVTVTVNPETQEAGGQPGEGQAGEGQDPGGVAGAEGEGGAGGPVPENGD